ncbi:MAG: TIGR03000 domain-containing protein [Gemmataceae bacterium]
MRCFLVIVAAGLAVTTPAMAQRAFKPFVPISKPVRPGANPALAVYPDLTTYFQSAMFFEDFPRRYALSQGPAVMYVPVPVLPPPPPPPEEDPERAKVTVQVPLTAEVFIQGEKLKQNGATRVFYSPPLDPSLRYRYQVLVRWNQNGKLAERKLDVSVAAGEHPVLMVLAPVSK